MYRNFQGGQFQKCLSLIEGAEKRGGKKRVQATDPPTLHNKALCGFYISQCKRETSAVSCLLSPEPHALLRLLKHWLGSDAQRPINPLWRYNAALLHFYEGRYREAMEALHPSYSTAPFRYSASPLGSLLTSPWTRPWALLSFDCALALKDFSTAADILRSPALDLHSHDLQLHALLAHRLRNAALATSLTTPTMTAISDEFVGPSGLQPAAFSEMITGPLVVAREMYLQGRVAEARLLLQSAAQAIPGTLQRPSPLARDAPDLGADASLALSYRNNLACTLLREHRYSSALLQLVPALELTKRLSRFDRRACSALLHNSALAFLLQGSFASAAELFQLYHATSSLSSISTSLTCSSSSFAASTFVSASSSTTSPSLSSASSFSSSSAAASLVPSPLPLLRLAEALIAASIEAEPPRHAVLDFQSTHSRVFFPARTVASDEPPQPTFYNPQQPSPAADKTPGTFRRQALSSCKQALELVSESREQPLLVLALCTNISYLHLCEGNFEQAHKAALRGISVCMTTSQQQQPAFVGARDYLTSCRLYAAESLCRLGDVRASLAYFAELQQHESELPNSGGFDLQACLFYNTGVAQLLLGNHATARACATRALCLSPSLGEARTLLAYLGIFHGQSDVVLSAFNAM